MYKIMFNAYQRSSLPKSVKILKIFEHLASSMMHAFVSSSTTFVLRKYLFTNKKLLDIILG